MPHIVTQGRRVRGFVIDPRLLLGIVSNGDAALPCPTGDVPAGATLVGYDATEAGIVLWVEHESFDLNGAFAAEAKAAPVRYPTALLGPRP